MREALADLVYPILTRALAVKERLERGEKMNLEMERAALKALLLSDAESRKLPDFGGDVDLETLRGAGFTALEIAGRTADVFLGARYILTCWLDELFILDSAWGPAWNERKLEMELYGTNDRAWKFWEQAKLAEKRADADPLEVCYLAVMLGFRGNLVGEREGLSAWTSATQARLARGQSTKWEAPPEIEPKTDVPPLFGRRSLQRMVLLGGICFLTALPFVILFVVQQLGQ